MSTTPPITSGSSYDFRKTILGTAIFTRAMSPEKCSNALGEMLKAAGAIGGIGFNGTFGPDSLSYFYCWATPVYRKE